MKTPDYLSYERYKKKKDANPNRKLAIFVTTFFVTLFLFSIVAKSLSPDVDVTIGSDSEMEPKETGLGVKKFIDERLKLIQQDDNTTGASKTEAETSTRGGMVDYDTSVSEEKLKLPTKKNNQMESIEEEDSVMPSYNQTVTPPKPTVKSRTTTTVTQTEVQRVSKVFVGRYNSIEQARVAQDILMDSGMNVNPFVKDLGGVYTLQIGSYSTRSKAEETANELRRNGFPARVLQE